MKPFTKIASVIFGVVAIAHLLRLIIHFQVIVGSHQVPLWISVVGLIVALFLSMALWREAK